MMQLNTKFKFDKFFVQTSMTENRVSLIVTTFSDAAHSCSLDGAHCTTHNRLHNVFSTSVGSLCQNPVASVYVRRKKEKKRYYRRYKDYRTGLV